jgi:hypothetical protein
MAMVVVTSSINGYFNQYKKEYIGFSGCFFEKWKKCLIYF